jgi:peptidoglycan hydrolase FlgJ
MDRLSAPGGAPNQTASHAANHAANHAALAEAQALGALLKPVFGEAPKGLLSGGAAEAQWRPMLVENYARSWSDRGGLGIADAVFREMLRMQSAAQGQANPEGTTP